MTPKEVAVLVGSLRKDSFSRKLALALQTLAPPPITLQILDIEPLPMYNQDFDDAVNPPRELTVFRQAVLKFDAVLFVTPEYNRSVPAVLKNALDVGSRPWGRSIWDGKPGAVVSITVGSTGAFGANHHLRQSLVTLNVPCMPQPEAYINNATDIFNANGDFVREVDRDFFRNFMSAFAAWVIANAPAKRPRLAA